MSISAARTIVLPAVPNGVTPQWPMIDDPDSVLDYAIDLTAILADVGGDTITSASVSVKPSGGGELQIDSVACAGAVVTANLTGGVYGRHYWVKIDADLASGRVFAGLVRVKVNPALMDGPLGTPPSIEFGTPVICSLSDDAAFMTVGG